MPLTAETKQLLNEAIHQAYNGCVLVSILPEDAPEAVAQVLAETGEYCPQVMYHDGSLYIQVHNHP